MLALTLAEVLPEEDEGPPPPWDARGEYRCSNVEVYFQVRWDLGVLGMCCWGVGVGMGKLTPCASIYGRDLNAIVVPRRPRGTPAGSSPPRAPTSRGWRRPTP